MGGDKLVPTAFEVLLSLFRGVFPTGKELLRRLAKRLEEEAVLQEYHALDLERCVAVALRKGWLEPVDHPALGNQLGHLGVDPIST